MQRPGVARATEALLAILDWAPEAGKQHSWRQRVPARQRGLSDGRRMAGGETIHWQNDRVRRKGTEQTRLVGEVVDAVLPDGADELELHARRRAA